MDIFNRTPSISEDTIQYTLYPPSGQCDKSSVTALATCVRSFVESSLPEFIWHRDTFGVKVVSDPDGEGWVLEGRMRVGDCVDDEWCVVWLLREISAKWDVVVSVFDSDGDFLLIESADVLPAWVKPSNSENRVWIYGSRLHLIPILHVSPPSRQHRRRRLASPVDEEEDENIINASDALKLVRDSTIHTLAPPEVEKIVWRRISGYPEAAREHMHIAKAYLPIDIVKILSIAPSLVQKPVEAFYTRDAIQLRVVHRMARFPPEPCVLQTVKLTRTAYAQLVGQKFYPRKIFGRWKEVEGTPEWRWRDVGMKIASGFEMLYQESKGRTDDLSAIDAAKRKQVLRGDPDYVKYLQVLTSANYFKGEREGSRLWSMLEDKAATAFVDVRREDDVTRQSFASLVKAALSRATNAPITSTIEDEEPDDWLKIDAEDFDNMLEKTMGASRMTQQQPGADPPDVNDADHDETPEGRLANDQALKLQKLAGKVEEFVQGEGDLDGAVFEDDELSEESVENDSDDDSDDDVDTHAEDQTARQAAMDELVPRLDPADYGKMPASFYHNSQKVGPTAMNDQVAEEDEDEETQPIFKPIRKPILTRDKFDGVDSDDETDEEDAVDDESEEDRPQVVGDVEIDIGEEEEEFLEFSRQALGITEEQWIDIVRDRESRGAFVPSNVKTTKKAGPGTQKRTVAERNEFVPGSSGLDAGPTLDSFEAVMQAMDAELARSRKQTAKSASTSNSKGKGREHPDENIEAAMDAELRAALEGNDSDDGDGEGEESVDYNLIKNFLESFKSQGGLSGPVSNLAGRLQPGWALPRDEK